MPLTTSRTWGTDAIEWGPSLVLCRFSREGMSILLSDFDKAKYSCDLIVRFGSVTHFLVSQICQFSKLMELALRLYNSMYSSSGSRRAGLGSIISSENTIEPIRGTGNMKVESIFIEEIMS